MLKDDVIKIIRQGVNNQNELLNKLDDLGYTLTQSSISRKLKQFGIIKIDGRYKIDQIQVSSVINIEFTEPNLFIIRTSPGHASSIASIIDQELVNRQEFSQFLGTIAGDDTIFVAVDLSDRGYAYAYSKLKEVLL